MAEAMRAVFAAYDGEGMKCLAAKGDLQLEIEEVKNSLLKWQIGIGVVIITIMTKGFGWIGF